ncbi:PQQ-dependent sugar dehydrogenase [Bacillus tianshenii]|nr:PQQ-dependent sugar dehydrogenase [Bacillus tianshenii]
MPRVLFIIGMCMVVLAACGNEQQKEAPNEETFKQTESTTDVEVVAENLRIPWEIVHIDDTFYISERVGSIVSVKDGKMNRKDVKLEKSLSDQPEAGLLGLALPPDFVETKEAFAYYSYRENSDVFQRIVKIKESEEAWVETGVIIDQIPGGQFHQGGRLEIGPDGKLYATTGDATVPESAQDLDSLSGKVLRINLDGSIPNDNPFPESYVFTYGHRNPQGLAWNEDGELYATEHGPSGYDEINLLQPGKNYGWPVIQGDETAPDMESPLIHSGKPSWAPSGMTYQKGNFYFASLRGEALRRFDPQEKKQAVVVDGFGRIRDALATESGVYFITNNTDGRGTPDETDDKLLKLKEAE